MAEEKSQLESIVVDGTWKRQGLVVAVADHTPLQLDSETSSGQNRRPSLLSLPARLVRRLGDRLLDMRPEDAYKRILMTHPNLLEHVNREDLIYFADQIEIPLQFLNLKAFDTRVILNRALDPYLLYAALREIAINSDERTVNFIYIGAHSDGRTLSNSVLSKFGLTETYLQKHTPEITRYLLRTPPQQTYSPADIAQRLRKGKGVNILYIESCCAGDLFEGNMPPRTVVIATSEADQLNGGPVLNRSFRRAYTGELMRSRVNLDNWDTYAVDITNLKPDGLPFDVQPPHFVVEEVNALRQKLEGTNYRPLKPNSTLVIKGNIRLAV